MNNKQIAIAISLLISCPIALSATYSFQDKQATNQKLISPLEHYLDTPSFNQKLPSQLAIIEDKKNDFFYVVNLLEKNQLEAAENKINTLIKQYPNESEFYNLQALLEILRAKNNLAIKSYHRAIELNPKSFIAHQGLAELYLQSGNLTQAKEQANISLSINDKSAHAYLLLANIAYKENNQQDIENILLTALEKTQGSIHQEIAIANNLAKYYSAQKQPAKILTLAHNIIRHQPDNNFALSFLANAQILNTKNTEAAQTLEKLIKQERKDTKHRLLLASILIGQPEKEQQVIKLLDEATSISPDNLQLLAQKSILLTKIQHFKAALNVAYKVKQLAPDTGLAELLEGNIYIAQNKPNQALEAYQKSYKLNPNSGAINQITNIMITQGNQLDAIDFLTKELENNPKNLDAHFKLAIIYGQQKNSNKAEKHYQAILTEQPNNALILNNLAWLYLQQNNPKALSLAEKAYQKAPESAIIADTYGTILVKQGALKRGIQILEEASKTAPTAYDIQYHLANAYALNGDRKQAQIILNTIVKVEQFFPEKNAAIKLLTKLEKN